MNRFLALCLVLTAGGVGAHAAAPPFPFTFYLHDTTGLSADTPLPSIYQFTATPAGSNSHFVVKAVNTSSAAAFLGQVFVSAELGTTSPNTNFTITGLASATALPIGGSLVFTVNFSPTAAGSITAFLKTSYQIQQNGCSFTSTDPDMQCPSGLNLSATLNGVATQPELVLSYAGAGGNIVLQPGAAPLNFGNVSISSTAALKFTLSNQSAIDIVTPAIAVPAPTIYTANPYLLDISSVPSILAAGASANFTITFEPGQTGLATTNLVVGANTYGLQGAGIIVADIDALQVSYYDRTGVRSLPQAATPIAFGQIVAGTSGSNVLTFSVANPPIFFNAIAISGISVTGAGFTLSALTGATSFPASVAPGSAVGFQITFTPSATGNYAGLLAIGTRTFALAGLSINSPLPSLSLAVSPLPLTSQQQATVNIQLAARSPLNLTGTIALAFAPSLTGVTDDPAILFLANSGRELAISVAAGAQSATYAGDSALNFQTGTTAGTLTFSVTFPNTPTFTQSYTITPELVKVTNASALRLSPNLVVTVTGFDNTYSAGQLGFTFYDTAGKQIQPISVDATSNFKQLFFNNNQGGGTFSAQATFPVTGSVTSVGSVAVTVNNSVGQTSFNLAF